MARYKYERLSAQDNSFLLMERPNVSLRPYQLAWWLTRLIRGYRRFISPLLGQNCRYNPTCSSYALESISRNGGIKGGWLGLKRVGRCHPFRDGGNDPVPDIERSITDTEGSA